MKTNKKTIFKVEDIVKINKDKIPKDAPLPFNLDCLEEINGIVIEVEEYFLLIFFKELKDSNHGHSGSSSYDYFFKNTGLLKYLETEKLLDKYHAREQCWFVRKVACELICEE